MTPRPGDADAALVDRVETAVYTVFFDGALDPAGGATRPGASGTPGHGLELRVRAAERYRVR